MSVAYQTQHGREMQRERESRIRISMSPRQDFLQRLNTIVLPRVRDFEGPDSNRFRRVTPHRCSFRPCMIACIGGLSEHSRRLHDDQ